MTKESQNQKIWKALKAGRKLTSMAIIKLTGSTAPATRISEVQRQMGIPVSKRWLKRNGKRFVEWSL